jgi:hypothetical protein
MFVSRHGCARPPGRRTRTTQSHCHVVPTMKPQYTRRLVHPDSPVCPTAIRKFNTGLTTDSMSSRSPAGMFASSTRTFFSTLRSPVTSPAASSPQTDGRGRSADPHAPLERRPACTVPPLSRRSRECGGRRAPLRCTTFRQHAHVQGRGVDQADFPFHAQRGSTARPCRAPANCSSSS